MEAQEKIDQASQRWGTGFQLFYLLAPVSLRVCLRARANVCVDSYEYRITVFKKHSKNLLDYMQIPKLYSCSGFIASSLVHMPGSQVHLTPKELTCAGRADNATDSCSLLYLGGSSSCQTRSQSGLWELLQ